mgnify:FL=1
MNKIKLILLFLLIKFILITSVNAKLYKRGEILTDQLQFSKNIIIPLSDGSWEVVEKYGYTSYFLQFKGNAIARVKNNKLLELIYVEQANLSGQQMGALDNSINSIIFKDPYDGCYERPEYHILEVYKRGSTHNCLVIRHIDTYKDLYTPDDKQRGAAEIKKWIKTNSIEIPKIAFGSFHSYFSRRNKGEWYLIQYWVDPELFDTPKIKFLSEETSEFHKANIQRFPEHKIAFDNWISEVSKKHKYFEKIFKAEEKHLLNLDKYVKSSKNTKKNNNTSIVIQIKNLQELYESGALTEEEFKKAKNKILN